MLVVGTAGHVDHGKSSLIHALTGKHPDRLKEEQIRGMTIDLGYAWMQIEEAVISFVDVPGHNDFLDNMLVGISEVQAALLVVDANEGIMPQTIEHAHILRLQGIEQGIVALTKVDLVEDVEWLEWVEDEIYHLLHQAGLPTLAIIHTSVVTGQGLDELKTHLLRMTQHFIQHDQTSPLRLPIDRVFQLKGHGTIVTGTLQGESLPVGVEVMLAPSGLSARIRQIQSHHQTINIGQVGDRLAVNLSNIHADQIQRGDVLIYPHALQPSLLCDVYYRHLPDVSRPLKHGEQVRLFVGTSKLIATVHAPHLGMITAGQVACLQLSFRDKAVILRGDRFVVRMLSPSETLGGGIILDPLPAFRYRKQNIEAWQRLEKVAQGTDQEWLASICSQSLSFTLGGMTMRTNYSSSMLMHHLKHLIEAQQIEQVGKDRYSSTKRLQQLAQHMIHTLDAFLQEHPHYVGMRHQALASLLNVDVELIMVALRQAPTELVQTAEGWVTLTKHRVGISDELQRLAEQTLAWLNHQPFSPPELDTLMSMGLTQDTLAYLNHSQAVVFINPHLIVSQVAYTALVERIQQLGQTHPTFSVAEVRDDLQTSRKYALAYLEHLDKLGITIRSGEKRRLKNPNQAG